MSNRRPKTSERDPKTPDRTPEGGGEGSRPRAHSQPAPPLSRAAPSAPTEEEDRNPGVSLDLGTVRRQDVSSRMVEREAASLAGGSSVEGEWKAAWLLRGVTFLDLTSLSVDDTPESVRRLCATARQPVRSDLVEVLDSQEPDVRVAAVCVYPSLVTVAVQELAGSGIPVATVAADFPSGRAPLDQRVREIRSGVDAGAREIDAVIDRGKVLRGEWRALYEEVRAFREACGEARLKTILATGELGTLENVARASQVCMMAGADFIKTSTGKERINATLPVGLVMARAIREYHGRTGHRVGFKPAGGIRKAEQCLSWLHLVKQELGEAWLARRFFRIGASSLLADVERELERLATRC